MKNKIYLPDGTIIWRITDLCVDKRVRALIKGSFSLYF